jgi:hypothetical protein
VALSLSRFYLIGVYKKIFVERCQSLNLISVITKINIYYYMWRISSFENNKIYHLIKLSLLTAIFYMLFSWTIVLVTLNKTLYIFGFMCHRLIVAFFVAAINLLHTRFFFLFIFTSMCKFGYESYNSISRNGEKDTIFLKVL